MTVISGAVDTRRFSPDRGDRPAARRKLLYVGRLSAGKAVTDLIEALPDVASAHLVIAGRGVAPPRCRIWSPATFYPPGDIRRLASSLRQVLGSPAAGQAMGRATLT